MYIVNSCKPTTIYVLYDAKYNDEIYKAWPIGWSVLELDEQQTLKAKLMGLHWSELILHPGRFCYLSDDDYSYITQPNL